jgi:hypothetical protein
VSAQPALPFPPDYPLLTRGSLTVQLPGDGRALVLVKSERGPAWLELLPDARAWLAEKLSTSEQEQEA